jgi:ferredoxin
MTIRLQYLSNVTSLKLNPALCTACRRCVEVCPRMVLTMKDKRAAIVDRDLCIECGACARNCEFGALSVNEGVGCATAIINGMLTGGEPTCGCSEPESGTSTSSCCG